MKDGNMTLLLFSNQKSSPKSLSIKKSLVKYSAIFVSFFVLISIIISIKFYNNINIIKKQRDQSVRVLLTSFDELTNDIEQNRSVEESLRNRLVQIEDKLLEMQNLLDEKGIKKKLAIGGEFIPADVLSSTYVENMQKDIDELYETMKSLPIGIPLSGPINSGYGYRKDPINSKSAFHPGVDIGAKFRQPVKVTADGIVKKAGWYHSYGKSIIIDHKLGYETLYGHLSIIKVKEGQAVEAGDIIGLAGSTGRSSGTHLHYEIINNGKRKNPQKYLSLK